MTTKAHKEKATSDLPDAVIAAAGSVSGAASKMDAAKKDYDEAVSALVKAAEPPRPGTSITLSRVNDSGDPVKVTALLTDVRLVEKGADKAASDAIVDRVAFACRGLALTDDGSLSRHEVRLTMSIRDLVRSRQSSDKEATPATVAKKAEQPEDA